MPNPRMSKARAKKIKLVLLDVDGVMTDGSIWLFPAPAGIQPNAPRQQAGKVSQGGGFGFHSETMIEAKGFNAHDGTAISLAHLAGLKVGLITKRVSDTVAIRARDLKLDHVHQGIQDKLTTFRQILGEEGLDASEAAYVGDDIIDLPVMRNCGLAIAVPNGRDEVKRAAHLVTEHPGGHGAVRDALEFILKAQGVWERVVEEYVKERSPEEKEEGKRKRAKGK